MLHVHVAVLKEPRGFIKMLQFLLAIIAFGTTVSFSTYFTFHATVQQCTEGQNYVVKNTVDYPFALDSTLVQQSLCTNPPVSGTFHFPTDTSPQAKFFVAMGVISMFYSLLALAGYVLLSDLYANSQVVPSVDFVVHGTLAFLWLVAAAAWAAGVATLKAGADPHNSLSRLCDNMPAVNCDVLGDDYRGGFGKLNASLCFGFLNMFVWAANLWFIFKETVWFKARPDAIPPAAPAAANA